MGVKIKYSPFDEQELNDELSKADSYVTYLHTNPHHIRALYHELENDPFIDVVYIHSYREVGYTHFGIKFLKTPDECKIVDFYKKTQEAKTS